MFFFKIFRLYISAAKEEAIAAVSLLSFLDKSSADPAVSVPKIGLILFFVKTPYIAPKRESD